MSLKNLPKGFLKNPGIASTLPQYVDSNAFYERFLDDTQNNKEETSRAINVIGFKKVDMQEIKLENWDYFFKNRGRLHNEFFGELSSKISKPKANMFCEIISEFWGDGRTKRENEKVIQLMASVQNYFVQSGRGNSVDEIRVQNIIDKSVSPNFLEEEIAEILGVNTSMLDGHLPNWLESLENYDEKSSDSIYFRRGLFLDSLFDQEQYYEWAYLNSYSLAFTITEKFAKIEEESIPVIVNINWADVRDRVLFFSPFIKNMSPAQLELGIIPSFSSQTIRHQGIFGGIHEYLLEQEYQNSLYQEI